MRKNLIIFGLDSMKAPFLNMRSKSDQVNDPNAFIDSLQDECAICMDLKNDSSCNSND